METKEHILGVVDDLVTKFFYYDRKHDEELTVDLLYDSMRDGTVTADDIIEKFAEGVRGEFNGVLLDDG